VLVGLTGCGATKPNVTVHMVPGSVRSECLQVARYNVLSGRELVASKDAETTHGLKVQLALFKAIADQLPTGDPVRSGALKYVAHGTTYPYFQPCRHLMNRVGTGFIPLKTIKHG
jgi:hypothetical protein